MRVGLWSFKQHGAAKFLWIFEAVLNVFWIMGQPLAYGVKGWKVMFLK